MAQHETGLDAAVVLVALQRERRVDRGLAVDLGHAEGDRARPHAAGLHGETDVLSLPHRPGVPEPGRGDEQRDAGVGGAEGRQALELLGQGEAELVAGHDGVGDLGGHEVVRCEDRRGVGLERGPERADLGGEDLAARGGAVSAVAGEVRGGGVQAREQVEPGDRAPRAGAPVAVERHEHGRPVMALGDPRGDDPDHAGVPALAGENEGGRAALRRAGRRASATWASAANRIRVSV